MDKLWLGYEQFEKSQVAVTWGKTWAPSTCINLCCGCRGLYSSMKRWNELPVCLCRLELFCQMFLFDSICHARMCLRMQLQTGTTILIEYKKKSMLDNPVLLINSTNYAKPCFHGVRLMRCRYCSWGSFSMSRAEC